MAVARLPWTMISSRSSTFSKKNLISVTFLPLASLTGKIKSRLIKACDLAPATVIRLAWAESMVFVFPRSLAKTNMVAAAEKRTNKTGNDFLKLKRREELGPGSDLREKSDFNLLRREEACEARSKRSVRTLN